MNPSLPPKPNYLPDYVIIRDGRNLPNTALTCKLYFNSDPHVNLQTIQQLAQETLGRVDLLNGPLPALAFPDLLEEATLCTIVISVETFPLNGNLTQQDAGELTQVIEQSWNFADAGHALQNARYCITIIDHMFDVQWRKRFHYFHQILLATLKSTENCTILHWVNSQCMIDPNKYLDIATHQEDGYLLGAINARQYRIQGTGDYLVDTLGLAVLGLPDLQCHFKASLNPLAVQDHLFNYARLIFAQGPIFDDGNTLEGIPDTGPWHCQYQISLMGPERVVVDLNPGSEFAAGDR